MEHPTSIHYLAHIHPSTQPTSIPLPTPHLSLYPSHIHLSTHMTYYLNHINSKESPITQFTFHLWCNLPLARVGISATYPTHPDPSLHPCSSNSPASCLSLSCISTLTVTLWRAGCVDSLKMNSDSDSATGGSFLWLRPTTLDTKALYTSCFLRSCEKGREEIK